jgi:hypothetical protein
MTPFFQDFLCHLRSIVDRFLLGQSCALSAPLTIVLFELLAREPSFVMERSGGVYYCLTRDCLFIEDLTSFTNTTKQEVLR